MDPYLQEHIVGYEYQRCRVFDLVFNQQKSVFLTGPGGTGKSEIIQDLVDKIERDNNELLMQSSRANITKLALLAPTHAAAERFTSASTIHSYFKERKTPTKEKMDEIIATKGFDRRGEWRAFPIIIPDLMIIDEISMVGENLLEMVHKKISHNLQTNDNQLFGGVQTILSGDFAQLPPVADRFLLQTNLFDNNTHFVPIHLSYPLRQTADPGWAKVLSKVRVGFYPVLGDIPGIYSRYIDKEELDKKMKEAHKTDSLPVILSCYNKSVEEYNNEQFSLLNSNVESTWNATDVLVKRTQTMVSGRSVTSFVPVLPSERTLNPAKMKPIWNLPNTVSFKEGARYIITKSLFGKPGIRNGKTCVYIGGLLRLADGTCYEPQDFQTRKLSHYEGNYFTQRTQLCLRLGYAVTIHRSQGMTLDSAIIDASIMKQAGQMYTALSRVRSLQDLYIINARPDTPIKTHPKVINFYDGHRPVRRVATPIINFSITRKRKRAFI